MRESASDHCQSLKTLASEVWPNLHRNSTFRPNLNASFLEELAREALTNIKNTSKKRRLSPSGASSSAKRARTASGPITSSRTLGDIYPKVLATPRALRLENAALEDPEEVAPVLRHVFNIDFIDLPSEHSTSLADLLAEVQSPVPLGTLQFRDYGDRVVAGVLPKDGDLEWLLLVPELRIEAEDYDFTTCIDFTAALMILQDAKCIELQSSIFIVPQDSSLRVQLECLVSLRLPHVFFPSSRKETKKNATLITEARRRLFSHIWGNDNPTPSDTNISHFYSVLGAADALPSKMADDAMQPDLLNPTLLPFQRRSVGWLLKREGMGVTDDGSITPISDTQPLMHSFWDTVVVGNHSWFYNRLSGELVEELPSDDLLSFGGILAEEPGLGKTLETISLILLNPAPPSRNPAVTRWDPEARLDVKAVKSTLIVTPPSLASQWIDEIRAHAPSLKVLVYDGWSKVKVPITNAQMEEAEKKAQTGKTTSRKASKSKAKGKSNLNPTTLPEDDIIRDEDGNLLEWCDYVQQFDVVVTTYQVLKTDFNVARAAPVRPRREDVVYVNIERPRSPLVMVEWNRVVMDEVQMVGGGKVEDMVSLIPRLSSFAVSGTPAKAQISDMIHVLKFLRVDNTIGSNKLWNRLLKPGFSNEFAAFFQTYAIRTTKGSVKDELTIPQQTRYLVPIELGRVERHVYDQTLEQILLELGLDSRGVAATEGWEVDANLLRTSIRRLRGICTHPQVGQLQRNGENYKKGALKTMDAVLATMTDQNWKNIMEHWKAKIQTMVQQARLILFDEQRRDRHQIGQQLFDEAEAELKKHMDEINAMLDEHKVKGELLKREAREARKELDQSTDASEKGKGRVDFDADEEDDDDDDLDAGDTDVKGFPKTPAGKEHIAKTASLKNRLRDARLILHQVTMLKGDLFHVVGNPAEDDAYRNAEAIRKELLRVTEEDATRSMQALQEYQARLPKLEDMEIEVPYLEQGGIRSAELIEEVNEMIEDVLNEQTRLIWTWRARIMDLLTQSLNAGDEADGQEYQRGIDSQGEAEVYLQAYALLLADRQEALVNERTLLAAHDAREKRLRHTKAAIKAARALDFLQQAGDDLHAENDFEVNPEDQVLHQTLSEQRKELVKALGQRSIKSVLVDLNGVLTRITRRDDPEYTLVSDAVSRLRSLTSTQGTLHNKLDADLTLMRKTFNDRILYFRQLQEISDSVAEVEWEEPTLELAIQSCITNRADHDAKINMNRARHRYLVNLVAGTKDGESAEEEENVCILCRCDFIRGFITQCAHIFCEGCMKAWLARREGKTCPVCRVAVNPDTVQRFTTSQNEEAPKQPINGESAPQSRRKIVYNNIDPALFKRIENMELYGDYGSKIQTLVRHLLYLQSMDPGTKSIVFSAWADSLHIVEWALSNNGIRTVKIDQNSKGESAAKRFRTDPEISVLLLHGERENAGLNVTCASRVFLLESVVHHSFEIQAIARIDRMGQTRPTEVYCYYAEDTVERNILDLAARKNLSIYTKNNSAGTLNLSSFASQEKDASVVDSPAKNRKMQKQQKGDFIFRMDDMLAVLFPHMYEEIEFLLPEDAGGVVVQARLNGDVEMADVPISSPSVAMVRDEDLHSHHLGSHGAGHQNAVAGPSRPRGV
ncbi:SNF2 family N-terminal domain-containing protein [Coprinopsis sp. MPI-PUGE-AT-0042]|nr:SNF2 family N-terminal domain-containing protein [Coprinopsis sp. MPI-PUGE-AT-0042]